MPQKDCSSEFAFPDREPINRQDFALRHLLLEAIKLKLSDRRVTPIAYRKLALIAEYLSVERSDTKNHFSIRLGDTEVLTVEKEKFEFFSKYSEGASKERYTDPILESNFQRASDIILQLEELDLDYLYFRDDIDRIAVSCVIVFSRFAGDAKALLSNLSRTMKDQSTLLGWIDDYEIIVVDDCSPYHVSSELNELVGSLDKVRLVVNRRFEGLGSSFTFGLQYCQFEYILFIEAAAHLSFRELDRIFCEAKDFEVIVPYQQGFVPPLTRRIAVRGWSFLTRIFFGTLVREIDSHLKFISRRTLERIGYRYIRGRSKIFNTEILARIRRAGIRIKEIPVQVVPQESSFQRALSFYSVFSGILNLVHLKYLLGIERLSWFGFVTGTFSRTPRPLEMLEYRRSEILWKEEDIRESNCPVCDADYSYLRKTLLQQTMDSEPSNESGVLLCTKCRNAFTVPRDRIEKDTLPDITGKLSYFESLLLDYFAKIRVHRVLHALTPGVGPFKILDVGGGSCLFANKLAQRGHSVVVIDPHEEYSTVSVKESGVQFYQSLFEEGIIDKVGLSGKCDAVTFWHSLEHFNEPAVAIREAIKALRPNGVLYLCVPNINSLQAEISRQSWVYLDIPRHRFHFTLDGLLTLLEPFPLERHHVHWWSSEYEIFGFFQSYLNLLSGSHNYYYNSRKKGKSPPVPYPVRNRWVHRFSFFLVPLAFVSSLFGCAVGKPSCVELHSYRRTHD